MGHGIFELVAIGPRPADRWRRPLPSEELVRLGRSPADGWAVPWDMRISREHADLIMADDGLHIRCLETAQNAIHWREHRLRDVVVQPRDGFRIGSTDFRLIPAGEPLDRSGTGVPCGTPQQIPEPSAGCVRAHSQPNLDVREIQLPAETPVVDVRLCGARAGEESGRLSASDRLDGQAGSYVLAETIHRGSWAEVYMGRHSYLDRWAAVQVPFGGTVSAEEATERLEQKARLLATFRHPQLPICLDAGDWAGTTYLAMEWIQGRDLNSPYTPEPLTVGDAIEYVRQTASTLAYVHRSGVVHRELSPHHLLVDSAGHVTVIGWSRALRVGDSSMVPYERRGLLIGEASFVAPEQIEDCRRVDVRADIYSLGRILDFLLARCIAIPAEASSGGPGDAQSAARLAPPKRVEVPAPLQILLGKMLARSPADRLPRMESVIESLETC